MTNVHVGCAVLAAGAGRRFGTPGAKLVAQYLGKPLLQHAIDAACASSAEWCTLVLGAAADRVRACIDPRRCAVVLNSDWEEGIASSVRCAIGVHANDDGCILMLGDQPNVTSIDLSGLIAAFASRTQSIVSLRSGDVWGAPAMFGRGDYPALRALSGDRGAKGYVTKQKRRVVFVEAARADAFADVDSVSDLTT